MPDRIHLLTTEQGIRHEWEDHEDGTYTVHSSQDVETLLDLNKAMANHNDGYSPSKDIRRAARVPLIIWLKWLNEEGWDAWAPENEKKLFRKLNDPDWKWLRTAPGYL